MRRVGPHFAVATVGYVPSVDPPSSLSYPAAQHHCGPYQLTGSAASLAARYSGSCPHFGATCYAASFLAHGPARRATDVVGYYCYGPGDSYTAQGCASGAAVRDHLAEAILIDLPVGLAVGGAGKSLLNIGRGGASASALRSAGLADDWATSSGILRTAAQGKGNFGLGSATASLADELGRAWIGSNYRVAGDGKTLVSSNGLRQYRPPSYKPNIGRTQANFETRYLPEGQWQANGHLDIVG